MKPLQVLAMAICMLAGVVVGIVLWSWYETYNRVAARLEAAEQQPAEQPAEQPVEQPAEQQPVEQQSDAGIQVVCWFDWGPHPPLELEPPDAITVYGDGRKAWCWGFQPTSVGRSAKNRAIVWEAPRGEPGTCQRLVEYPEEWQPRGYEGCKGHDGKLPRVP